MTEHSKNGEAFKRPNMGLTYLRPRLANRVSLESMRYTSRGSLVKKWNCDARAFLDISNIFIEPLRFVT